MQFILPFYNFRVFLIKRSWAFEFGIANRHIRPNRRIVNGFSDKGDFKPCQRC